MSIYFIGVDGEQVVDSVETAKQIEVVKKLNCNLQNDGNVLTWDDFDNSEESRTLFQSILGDRKIRVDEKTFMADRPAFCVITEHEGDAVRLEYYEGHDALSLVYDIRAKELTGKDLPKWMESDPQAYDPVKFLKDVFGFPEGFTKPILEDAHKKEGGIA